MRPRFWVMVAVCGFAHANAAPAPPDLAAIEDAAPKCPTGDSARTHCVGIRLHVAPADRATPAWVANQLAAANRHFAPLDVGFQLVAIDALPDSEAHVTTRTDRNHIATDRLGVHAIDVFIVARLDDVDASGVIYGVTWRPYGHTYIIVSAEAWERTLAHELGHFFGLPHSTYPISIMNKSVRDEPPMEQRTFAESEIAVIRAGLRRLERDKTIVDL